MLKLLYCEILKLKRTYAAHIFPWTIPAVISSNMVKPLTKFPVGIESYIIIIALFIFSVIGSYIYINKMDIQ